MRFSPEALARLDAQAGVVARWQLRGLGYERPQIDAMIRRGHLTPILHGVYLRSGAGWCPEQEAIAAAVRCGPGARVSGWRVLGLLGVEDVAPNAAYTILLPPGRRIRNLPFDTSRDHRPDRHGARVGPVPATTPSRALLEVATERIDDADLLSLLDRARWRRLLTVERVLATADELPAHRGARRLRTLLAAGHGDQESPGERAFAATMEGFDPPLEWQVYIAPDLRVDALWRDAALVIEYQGRDTHDHPRDRAADAIRHERVRGLGYEVVVVDRHDLREPDALRARLEQARTQRLRRLGRS
jgi:hypothetical protein